MALKIRLRQQGRSNSHAYRLVVMDVRQARDGKYVEALGWYHPHEQDKEKTYLLKPDRIQHWLDHGAELSERGEALIAQGAPEVLRRYKDKVQAHRAKQAAKKRANRRSAAAKSA